MRKRVVCQYKVICTAYKKCRSFRISVFMYAHTDQNLYLVSYMNMINKHCLLMTLNVVNTPALEPVELRAELHNLSDCT